MKPSARSSPSLAQQAYRDIKEQILLGRLRPGEMVLGKQFAAQYRMSRTPVHDALKLLCQEGLVEVIPRVGYVVTTVSLGDVQQIFDLRLALELFGVERAVGRVTPADLTAFDQVDREIRALAHALSPDEPDTFRRAGEANRKFHLMVAGLSGNRRLVEALGRLLDESQRVIALDPESRLLVFLSPPLHRELIEALVAGDKPAAREAVIAHLREVQERIVRAILPETVVEAVPAGDW
ncbi:MAG TPA: GntR family transcriptional regulator [Thermomicrobiales bacterium]|nr:GntR family transcriptional regulator [Thermomicrobiales bacterium]